MSQSFTTPAEIAREALRRLALGRMAPTPDNFRTYYHRIAGTEANDAFPSRTLSTIVADLPRNTPEALRVAQQMEKAIAAGQWPALREVLLALAQSAAEMQPSWGALLRELVNQLDNPHSSLPAARKREALQHVLGAAGSDSRVLFSRLQGLVAGWSRSASQDGTETAANGPDTAFAPILARLLRRGIVPLAGDNASLAGEISALADSLERPDLADNVGQLGSHVEKLANHLEWLGEDQRAVREALLSLLRLIVDNIRELVIDDSWLHGQLSVLTESFSQPLDIRVLDEVERRLRDVIAKQGQLKRQLSDAQERLKQMLAGFIDRLANLSDTTTTYHDTLERCAREIGEAHDISELSDVVETMLRETREVRETTRRSGIELEELRQQVETANVRIASLQRELDATSELVRHDPLTGALNRKGLDEALTREIARCRRRQSELCLALLDVDNFKQINDTHGHKTGDDALRHLIAVVRDSLRAQDMTGRYGGEEFLIILPEAELDQAVAILTRLQRELTRRYFLADNKKLLITFSAGIALLGADEDAYAAIDRADKAMYAAKRAGKNRVLVAG